MNKGNLSKMNIIKSKKDLKEVLELNPQQVCDSRVSNLKEIKKIELMYKIQASQSGTRSIEVSDQHLETIEKYQLLRNLVDSNGIVDEEVLDKLKLNVRSLLESSDIKDKELLDLCLDVIYNQNMKALGLHNLVLLYVDWKDKKQAEAAADAEPDAVND